MPVYIKNQNNEIETRFLGLIVDFERVWNNSMYIYMDYVTVWNQDKVQFVREMAGADYFDSYGVEKTIDYDSPAYPLYLAYKDGLVKQAEREEVGQKEKKLFEIAQGLVSQGLGDIVVEFISKAPEWAYFENLANILINPRIRNKFKISLRNQVINWFRTPISRRKYNTPLSKNQISYI